MSAAREGDLTLCLIITQKQEKDQDFRLNSTVLLQETEADFNWGCMLWELDCILRSPLNPAVCSCTLFLKENKTEPRALQGNTFCIGREWMMRLGKQGRKTQLLSLSFLTRKPLISRSPGAQAEVPASGNWRVEEKEMWLQPFSMFTQWSFFSLPPGCIPDINYITQRHLTKRLLFHDCLIFP